MGVYYLSVATVTNLSKIIIIKNKIKALKGSCEIILVQNIQESTEMQ